MIALKDVWMVVSGGSLASREVWMLKFINDKTKKDHSHVRNIVKFNEVGFRIIKGF